MLYRTFDWLVSCLPLPSSGGLYFRIHCRLAAWAMFGFGKVDSVANDEELPF